MAEEKNPPLTPSESARLQGADWELAEFKKREAIKKARKIRGVSAEKIDAEKGELSENTRVVDLTEREGTGGPATVLKDTDINQNKPGRRGVRVPTNAEVRRGRTTGKVTKPRKPKPRPTVQRNPVTGRAEKRVITPFVTPLPVAGPDVMTPRTPGPRVPLEQPQGGVAPRLFIDKNAPKGERVSRKLTGFGGPVSKGADMAWTAMRHLDSMLNHKPGTTEHGKHLGEFDKIHQGIAAHTNSDVHGILQTARIVALKADYPKKQEHLNMAKDALTETISSARAMEGRRGKDSKAGNPKKGN
mgnify:FL=1